jgi:hypothetical protein
VSLSADFLVTIIKASFMATAFFERPGSSDDVNFENFVSHVFNRVSRFALAFSYSAKD